ncbi:MAG TPA: DUF1697 domain-containing protein [Polyangiaceae bacterium]|jgi:uncharacterized protein (DUF1697 family)|nr:DUF1697 domain-containing protein [Polyangiaceae bacterium]
MSTHVALLRAINVGGRNSLPMKTLARIFEELGCRNVRTYIQSGNVVFEASEALARRVPKAVHDAIQKEVGFSAPVLTRSASELGKVAKSHAFAKKAKDPKALHVAFLAELPGAERIALLDPKRSPPDEFKVVGREIHFLFPKGVGGSKYTNVYLDAKLGTVSTLRNMATVEKLLAMCGE